MLTFDLSSCVPSLAVTVDPRLPWRRCLSCCAQCMVRLAAYVGCVIESEAGVVRDSCCVLLSTGSIALQSLLDVLEESCRYFKTADGRWVAWLGLRCSQKMGGGRRGEGEGGREKGGGRREEGEGRREKGGGRRGEGEGGREKGGGRREEGEGGREKGGGRRGEGEGRREKGGGRREEGEGGREKGGGRRGEGEGRREKGGGRREEGEGGREKGGAEVVCVLVPLFGGVGLEGGGPNARSNVLELW